MEQSGRNQWQSVANGKGPKTAQSGENLAVRKEGVDGSSRQRASSKSLHRGFFYCWGRRRTAGATSTKRPPVRQVVPAAGARTLCWSGFAAFRSDVHRASTRSPRLQGVEEHHRVLAAVASEVAVVTVDHRQARAHEPREIEDGDAGAEVAVHWAGDTTRVRRCSEDVEFARTASGGRPA
jgi:hypothetical protein